MASVTATKTAGTTTKTERNCARMSVLCVWADAHGAHSVCAGILDINPEKKMEPSENHTKLCRFLLSIVTVGMLVQPLALTPSSLSSGFPSSLHICRDCALVAFI